MNSDQSSIRQIFEFPTQLKTRKPRRNKTTLKKQNAKDLSPKSQTFDKFVRKTKNVVLFAQKLKQKIAKKHNLNTQNLTDNELQYLQKSTLEMEQKVWFTKDSKFVFLIEALLLSTLLMFAWKKSFQFVFSQMNDYHIVNILTLFMYIVYGFVFCMTQYKNERQEILSSRQKIKQIYLKERFLSDLIVALMIMLQQIQIDRFTNSYAVFLIIRIISGLLAYQTIRQLAVKLQDSLSVNTHIQTTLAIMRLLLKIFLFLHFLSLILNVFAKIQSQLGQGPTWIDKFTGASDLQKYVLGWYWGATILSTVGFGEITPANYAQRFFISLVQVFCCMSFGYFVNVIGTLIRMKADRDEKYQKQNRSLNRYLNFLTLSQDLKMRIRTHFFNKHIIDKTYDSGEEKLVMQNLSIPLKTCVLQENNLSILNKCNHFQKMKSQILTKMALNLKRVIFAPQHILYSRQSREKKLWIIESGAVQQFTDNFQNCILKKKVSHFQQPGYAISWINFILQKKYAITAKACKFTVAYELQESKFKAVLQEDSKEWYKILGLKQLMIQNRREYVQKCLSCDRYTHNAIECPRIHYIRKDPYYLIQQSKNLHNFLNSNLKKYKYERIDAHYDWKTTFSENFKPNKLLKRDSEEVSSLDHTIDNFIKQMNRLNTLKMIANSNKKISTLSNKAEMVDLKSESQENLQKNQNRASIASLQQFSENMQQIEFQNVLLGQNNEFMPQHNFLEVINAYNRYLNKIGTENLIKNFNQWKK